MRFDLPSNDSHRRRHEIKTQSRVKFWREQDEFPKKENKFFDKKLNNITLFTFFFIDSRLFCCVNWIIFQTYDTNVKKLSRVSSDY